MYVDDIKLAGKKHNIDPMWKVLNKEVDLGEPTSFLDHVYFVEESYPTPHIHEQMTTSNYGYDTAYNFTHNNIMLEPNAMNNIDTVAHMNVHNTQY